MGESTKAVCCLVLMVASIAAALAWVIPERPDSTAWAFRIGAPILGLFALGLLFFLHTRADVVPDYLREIAKTYYNRDGFAFLPLAWRKDGIAYMVAYFQNQRDKPCIGRIALRPAKGFLSRAKIQLITFPIELEPAAFGIARVPMPIPRESQGKRQSFEIGAAVEHPEGKGELVRFHDGIFIRTNTVFSNTLGTTLTVIGAAGGMIVLSRPAKVKLELPSGVVSELPEGLRPEVTTLWKLGDPPLGEVS